MQVQLIAGMEVARNIEVDAPPRVGESMTIGFHHYRVQSVHWYVSNEGAVSVSVTLN